MREIKFRRWDTDEKYMEYLKPFQMYGYAERYRYMQYTGLVDMNGKKIFEGDVLFNAGDPPAFPSATVLVEWNVNGHWHFKGITPKRFIFGNEFPSWESEVIGNIYENPNLIDV